jgi:hypothetical protein
LQVINIAVENQLSKVNPKMLFKELCDNSRLADAKSSTNIKDLVVINHQNEGHKTQRRYTKHKQGKVLVHSVHIL